MKKIPSLILSMILLLSLSACSGNPRRDTETGGESGLYALGESVSGTEQIETLTGEIRIEEVSEKE